MIRVTTVVLITVVLAACGQAAEDEGTTSTGASPSTTMVGTTSTSMSSTTSGQEVTTTTTMVAPTTTSTNQVEGDWASQPVIVSGVNGVVLGWWDGTGWIEWSADESVSIEGGHDYQTVVLDSIDAATGAAPTEAPEFCSVPMQVALDGPELVVPESADLGWSPHGAAISAPWDVMPNQVSLQSPDDLSHEDAIAELLAGRGIDEEAYRIRQMVEADLDGDGAVETLVVADGDDPPVVAHDDYYSLVAQIDSDGEVTVVVDSPGGTDGFPLSYRIGAIADLNGDGIMEIVLSTLATESTGAAVYEWIPGEQRFDLRLRGSCGG